MCKRILDEPASELFSTIYDVVLTTLGADELS